MEENEGNPNLELSENLFSILNHKVGISYKKTFCLLYCSNQMVRLLQILLHKIYKVAYHQSQIYEKKFRSYILYYLSLLITLFSRSICK